jgi:hypothetical protein
MSTGSQALSRPDLGSRADIHQHTKLPVQKNQRSFFVSRVSLLFIGHNKTMLSC